MSQRLCRTISDLIAYGGCLIATCRRCGRVALISIHHLVEHFRERGWSLHHRDVRERLRCDLRTGGCDATEPWLAFHQGRCPPIAGISMMAVAPRGIDPVDWMLADERGRKRLIQQLRS